MDEQKNVVMADVLPVMFHEATTPVTPSPIPERTFLVSAYEFAKFSQYQEALKNSSLSLSLPWLRQVNPTHVFFPLPQSGLLILVPQIT